MREELQPICNPTTQQRMQAAVNCKGLARDHFRSRLGEVLEEAQWSTAFTPTLRDIGQLRAWVPRHLHEAVFRAPPGETEFERAGGKPLVFQGLSNPFESSLQGKAEFFRRHVEPASQKPESRMSLWAAWRAFVTFLAMEGELGQVMPATEEAMHGFATHLLLIGYSGASFVRFFEAIIDRHKKFQCVMRVEIRTVHRWVRTIKKHMGLPKREKFAIMPEHIRRMLRLPRESLKDLRDTTILVMGTICALRAGEIQRLDVCDLLWNVDGPDTLAVFLWYRKNDGFKQGLDPRIGKGEVARTCPLALIREYLQRAGLRVSEFCTKSHWRRSPCEACGRLFRNTTAGGRRMEGNSVTFWQQAAHDTPQWKLNRAVIDAAVKRSLGRIGVKPEAYTPVSMRRGGVSAAIAGNVNEVLWKLQSGHRSISWQNYADIVKTSQRYEFFKAFKL